jgi:hypothetical protein
MPRLKLKILVVVFCALLLTIACGSSSSSDPATGARRVSLTPGAGNPNRVDPPPDGSYIGKLVEVDADAAMIRFITTCSRSPSAGIKQLDKDQQRNRLLRVATPSYLVVFVKSRNEPNGGHLEGADLDKLAEVARQDSSARWVLVVDQSVVVALQEDNGAQGSASCT